MCQCHICNGNVVHASAEPCLLVGGLPNGEDISFSSMSGLLEMLLWHL